MQMYIKYLTYGVVKIKKMRFTTGKATSFCTYRNK